MTKSGLLGGLYAVAFLLAVWAYVVAANGLLTAFAILVVPMLFALLWRPGEPPALLFACGMQWLQATAAIFYTDFYGISLEQAFGSSDVATATWLSLIAVLVLATGMRTALFYTPQSVASAAREEARQLHLPALFIVYLVAVIALGGVRKVAFVIPGLTQVLYASLTIKWVLVFVLAYSVLEQRRHYALLGFAVLLEFTIGLLGYFAAFKSVFFLLLVTVLGTKEAFRPARLALTAVVAATLFFCGVAWTAIKSDYRDFISEGSGQQEVVVPMDERLEQLADLISHLTWDNLDAGLENMILRVSYVNYFALTLGHVPESTPHENGALWGGALKHIATPRFLFPDKAAIHDSERTEKYTGIKVAGEEQGTSISIGYAAESYIDFGKIGMFVPIYLLGTFFGLIYRGFVFRSRCKVVGFGAACAILIFGAYTLETSNIKLIGANVMVLLITGFFVVVVSPSLMSAVGIRKETH